MGSPSDGGNFDEGPIVLDHVSHDGPQPKKRKVADKEEGPGPSCHSCRKRKARCSRDQPCSSCVKLGLSLLPCRVWDWVTSANTSPGTDCVYDQEKSKPGMRPGAIESLNQRVGEYSIATFPQHGHSHLDPSRTREHVRRTRRSLAADVEQYQPPKSPRFRLLARFQPTAIHSKTGVRRERIFCSIVVQPRSSSWFNGKQHLQGQC